MLLKTGSRGCKNICLAVFLFIFTVFLCLSSELAIFSDGISGTDSSVFRYVAWLMQRGFVPYRDTFDHKGPLIYFIDYLGMMIHPIRGIWFLEIITIFVGMLFSYLTVRLFSSGKTALLTVVITYALLGDCYKGGNMTEEYAIPFIAVSLYFFLKYFYLDQVRKIELFLCGLCFAAVCFLRVNMIAVWITCIPAVLIYNALKSRWKETVVQILLFLAGCLTITAPLVLYLVWNRAFIDFWNTYIVFNFSYSGYESLRVRLECYKFFIDQPLIYLSVFGLLYAGYVYYNEKSAGQINGWILVVAVGSFVSTFPFMCMSGRNDITYEMILIPVLVYPIGFFIQSVLGKKEQRSISVTSCFIVFWIWMVITTPLLWKTWDKNLDANQYLMESDKKSWMGEIQYVVDTYCGKEDTISVFGNRDSVYLQCGKLSASRYSYQFPIVEVDREIYQEYLKDLEQNIPKVIIIDEFFSEEYEYVFKEWLETHFYRAMDDRETIYLRQQEGLALK